MQEIFVVYLLFWGWSAAESSLTKLFLVYYTYISICTNPVPNPGCVFPASMAACNLGPSLWTHFTRRLSTASGYKVSFIRGSGIHVSISVVFVPCMGPQKMLHISCTQTACLFLSSLSELWSSMRLHWFYIPRSATCVCERVYEGSIIRAWTSHC